MTGVSWSSFERSAPEIAAAGSRLLDAGGDGISIGFLATATGTGVPRIAPVCPIFCGDGVYLSAGARTPKVADLRDRGGFVLHAFLGAADEEFQASGRATEVTSDDERSAVHDAIPFPAFDRSDPIFCLAITKALWVWWEHPHQPDMRPVYNRWRA